MSPSPGTPRPLTCVAVIGTRPEAIKMAPVVLRLRERSDQLRTVLIGTGQHREVVTQALELFGLAPEEDLELMRADGDPSRFTARAIPALADAFARHEPDIVLAQGDTSTVFAAALAAFYRRIPLGHVEAGLRTESLYSPFPEEANRRLTSVLADVHFAPTETARRCLLREGVDERRIHLTGNPVIDALHLSREAAVARARAELGFLDPTARLLLVTAHRRENHGAPMERIARALARIVREEPRVEVLWPVHPNPAVGPTVRAILGDTERVHLVPPLGYPAFVGAMALATLVLTDSGGVQEEAPALGRPVLALRESTERPEGVATGNVLLVGTAEERIVGEARRLLGDERARAAMTSSASPYGDGRAAERIAQAVLHRLGRAAEPPEPFGGAGR